LHVQALVENTCQSTKPLTGYAEKRITGKAPLHVCAIFD